MKRFLKSSRTHLLLLALSLFVISTILGLSAYLNNVQHYSSSYRTASDEELGFSITGTQLSNQLITPGDTLSMPVGVKVTGDYPLYVFIMFDPPAGLTINGFNSSWQPIEEGSNVYYYGTSSGLYPLDKVNNPEVSILESVTLPVETGNNQSYELNITGYAVQADHVSANATPKAVFELAKEASKP